MEEKSKLAAFIAEKRNKAGLTQKELAEKLYISDTAVSKWERGLSYPDIALVPEICRRLNISEHEFFTACDDIAARRQQKELKNVHLAFHVYQWVVYGAYALGLLACFIVNLAVSHTLSWFFVVAASVLTAFTLTNLPFLLKRRRLVVTLAGLTASTFLLLWVIWLYTGGGWLLSSFIVAGAAFAWLWLSALVACRKSWPGLLRGGLVCLLAAVLLAGMNPLCGLLFGYNAPEGWGYLSLFDSWNTETVSNKIVFWILALSGTGLLAAQLVKFLGAKQKKG